MRLLILTPRTNNVEPILVPLRRCAELVIVEYDVRPWAEACRASHYVDAAIYFGAIPTHHGKFVPDVSQLALIKAPMGHICFDAVEPDWQPFLRQYADAGVFRVQATIDGVANEHCQIAALAPVTLDGWPVKPWVQRQRAAGICCHPYLAARNALLAPLVAAGMLTVRTRDDGPYVDYQKFMCDRRVVINVPLSGSGLMPQVKARVVESAMAGCLLLEQSGSPTEDWFEPGQDYLAYDAGNVLEQLEWAHAHPVEAEAMASRLHNKVLSEHSPQQFWARIFDGLGLP